ncbi:uncharacterized protein LOC105665576 [Ceratitis capitata]|uniref:uncharacterized protein LOC105665576 n=1 Tax=Ceratitis capitata TaxID=7213 RepID=UPI00061886FA|nr:uncharacterized protein LOC105665576 [Ceratitis capitata]
MEVKTIFRIAEFIICVVLFILWYALGEFAARAIIVMLICGTIFGLTIITAVMVAHEFAEFNEVIVYLILGAILFLICGGLTVGILPADEDGRLAHFIAAALFLANGIIFLIDFIMALKK